MQALEGLAKAAPLCSLLCLLGPSGGARRTATLLSQPCPPDFLHARRHGLLLARQLSSQGARQPHCGRQEGAGKLRKLAC